jgi:hypothetical protein
MRDLSVQPFCRFNLIPYVDINRKDLPLCHEYSPYMSLGTFIDWHLYLAIFDFLAVRRLENTTGQLPMLLLSAVEQRISWPC